MKKIKIFITNLFNRALLRFYSGGGAGYLTGNFAAGKEVGQAGRVPSFILNMGEWQLHLHHWLIAFAILISLFFFFVKKHKLNFFLLSPVFGFLLGLILHGIISYNDWHQIFFERKNS